MKFIDHLEISIQYFNVSTLNVKNIKRLNAIELAKIWKCNLETSMLDVQNILFAIPKFQMLQLALSNIFRKKSQDIDADLQNILIVDTENKRCLFMPKFKKKHMTGFDCIKPNNLSQGMTQSCHSQRVLKDRQQDSLLPKLRKQLND